MTKTYVIAAGDYAYRDVEPRMYQFVGTWRALLEDLCGVDYMDEDDLNPSDLPDDELVKLFDGANGDGQPYVMVWCVEDQKQVLG